MQPCSNEHLRLVLGEDATDYKSDTMIMKGPYWFVVTVSGRRPALKLIGCHVIPFHVLAKLPSRRRSET